ncbi:UbiA-like polyprenyltransferase [uncultured Alistipes sp.]|uniref:UbiA-like polyprenyltransferase n=1 Tax=uncultured Alistipes sp. TaxID=538949 RepID=UPI0025E3FCFB|nr:UbiA-like polyprenyltransferase [uncultured Alistipes sp.]
MSTLSKYLSLVKFAHTIFAMPFAAIGFVYASTTLPVGAHDVWWWIVRGVQVLLCMVFARNTAMGFNRWADRRIDAENPRTAGREIPAGKISPRAAMWFVAVNAALFVFVAATINPLTAILSPVALFVVVLYSYTKRFTAFAHLVLGLSLGIAPVGAYIAIAGRFAIEPCILSLLVMTWCGGFDIIYALQDAAFDRERGLHSIPARFSPANALLISCFLHGVSIFSLMWFASYCPGSWWLWTGVIVFTALLLLQHMLVTPTRQRHIGIAFGTLNGLASLTLAVCVVVDLLEYSEMFIFAPLIG